MRRLLTVALLLAAVVVATGAALGTGGTARDGYRVQAVFDEAALNQGADVLVAGVRVGRVVELDLTPDNKAALTLEIEDPRFAPFRADARCGTRLQSLIGERVVVCEPGTAGAGRLPVVPDGRPGAGEDLLGVERTYGSVDFDLVTAISRRPTNEQLSIVLAELGATTAARGPELAAIIRRANPALLETSRVLRILERQTDDLEGLAVDGDRALAELRTERRALVDLVRRSTRTAAATVDRRAELSATLDRLPAALDRLEPLMARTATFARRTTPVLRELSAAAPELGEAMDALAPFADRATPALTRLARTADQLRDDLPRLVPLADRLTAAGGDLRRPAADLAATTESLAEEDGIENLLRTIHGAAGSGNGFDARGHYLRNAILSGACGQYTTTPFFGCDSQFGEAQLEDGATAASIARSASEPLLDYLIGGDR